MQFLMRNIWDQLQVSPARGMIILLLGNLTVWSLNAAGINDVPPFAAIGRVVSQQSNEASARKGSFSFLYSNGWWQVEVKTESAFHTNIQNCMSIPGGVRHYSRSAFTRTNVVPVAIACPLTFPPPGCAEMFAVWLSLCPRPELPIIDAKRMHRFISVPTCQANLMHDPRNVGDYTAHFLNPESTFLSELGIANNGLRLDLSWPPPFALEAEPYPPPFEQGFVESKYKVTQTTNLNGYTWPVQSIYESFGVRQSKEDLQTISRSGSVEISVQSIYFSWDIPNPRLSAPAQFLASDERPPLGSAEKPVEYITGDNWSLIPRLQPLDIKEGERSRFSVGMTLPGFSVTDLDGKPLSLEQYRGKLVLVVFWSVGCGPCVEELRHLVKLYARYHGKGFEVIGISLHYQKGRVGQFIRANKIPWQNYVDGANEEKSLEAQYGVRAIPTSYLLDPQGKIIAKDLKGESLEKAVSDHVSTHN